MLPRGAAATRGSSRVGRQRAGRAPSPGEAASAVLTDIALGAGAAQHEHCQQQQWLPAARADPAAAWADAAVGATGAVITARISRAAAAVAAAAAANAVGSAARLQAPRSAAVGSLVGRRHLVPAVLLFDRHADAAGCDAPAAGAGRSRMLMAMPARRARVDCAGGPAAAVADSSDAAGRFGRRWSLHAACCGFLVRK